MHQRKNEIPLVNPVAAGKLKGNLIVRRLGSLSARPQPGTMQRPASASGIGSSGSSLLGTVNEAGRRNSAPMAVRAAYGGVTSGLVASNPGISTTSQGVALGHNLPPHHRIAPGRKSAPAGSSATSMFGSAGVSRLGSIAAHRPPAPGTIGGAQYVVPPNGIMVASSPPLPPHQQMVLNRMQQQQGVSGSRSTYGQPNGVELKKTARKASGAPLSALSTLGGHRTNPIGGAAAAGQYIQGAAMSRTAPQLHALGAGTNATTTNRYPRPNTVPHHMTNNPSTLTSTFPVHQNNSTKRRPSVQDHPRKKRRTDEHASSYVTAFGSNGGANSRFPREQPDCCIISCRNGVGQNLRFKLRLCTDDSFKASYISCGWNKICDFHFFSDKMRFKKMNNNVDDKLVVDDDEDEEEYHRLMQQYGGIVDNSRHKRKRGSSKYSDDDDSYNSTAGGHSHRNGGGLNSSSRNHQRSPSKLSAISVGRLHARHHMRRASLGRINTNVARRKHFSRFETVAVSPEEEASAQKRIRAADEEDDEDMSALNTSSASSSSSSNSTQNFVKTHQEEESFEMPPQNIHVLYHQTPITPCEDLINMHESSNTGGLSTIQKLLQSGHKTGFTPRSPGDLPLELISSTSVSAVPHFAKLDPAFQGNDEDSKKYFSQYQSPLFQLDSDDSEEDDDIEDEGESSEYDDMLIVEDHETSHWRRLDAYSSDEDDNLSTSDHSTLDTNDDDDDSSEIYILDASIPNANGAAAQDKKRARDGKASRGGKKNGTTTTTGSNKESKVANKKAKQSSTTTSAVAITVQEVALPKKLQEATMDDVAPVTRSSKRRHQAKSPPKAYNSEFATENLQNTTLTSKRRRTRSLLNNISDADSLSSSEEDTSDEPFIGGELSDNDEDEYLIGDREHRIVDLGMIC